MPGAGEIDGESGERYETFARVLTHDLRNPLEVATIRLETAIETGDTDHVEPALSAVRRIDDIVTGMESLLLDGGDIEREAVALAECATDAWALVGEPDSELEIGGDLGTVEASPGLLQELFENVFRNSVEHGSTADRARPDDSVAHGRRNDPRGDQGVTVRVGASDTGFYVADDGVGMSDDARERAFEAGFTTAEDGTGLGLAIVREIAVAHGWTVELSESAAGGVRLDIETRGTAEADDAAREVDQ